MPPSGAPAPASVAGPDGEVALEQIAREICRRYRLEFPDEAERYGDAGVAWCVHDNQYLLAWAIADVHAEHVDLLTQVAWLARVLGARDFPLDRLARDLVIAAEVVDAALHDDAVVGRLREAAASVPA